MVTITYQDYLNHRRMSQWQREWHRRFGVRPREADVGPIDDESRVRLTATAKCSSPPSARTVRRGSAGVGGCGGNTIINWYEKRILSDDDYT